MADIAALLVGLKDLTVAVAAAVTATVAVKGLNKWRSEIRGRADFDVARALSRATYKLRDEIQSCRTPLIRGTEFPSDYQTTNTHTSQEKADALAHVYRNRWAPIKEALQEFESQVLEAEALWGSQIRQSADKLLDCANELFIAIEAIIEDATQGGQNFEADRSFGRSMRAAAHASRNDANNELSNRILTAVREVEGLMREHLHREQR